MRFTLRVVDDLYERLNILATAKGVSRNSLIVEALWEYLQKEQKLRK